MHFLYIEAEIQYICITFRKIPFLPLVQTYIKIVITYYGHFAPQDSLYTG